MFPGRRLELMLTACVRPVATSKSVSGAARSVVVGDGSAIDPAPEKSRYLRIFGLRMKFVYNVRDASGPGAASVVWSRLSS